MGRNYSDRRHCPINPTVPAKARKRPGNCMPGRFAERFERGIDQMPIRAALKSGSAFGREFRARTVPAGMQLQDASAGMMGQ